MKNNPIFILANPQLGENIGMCMRAMLNFNYTNLRLIKPKLNWSKQAAIDTATGAAQIIMPNLKTYETTEQAIKDIHFLIATTARQRKLAINSINPKQAAKKIKQKIKQNQTCGILFGAEASGLNNQDITKAHTIININTNENFSSLNLAQTVLLIAYELNLTEQNLNKQNINQAPQAPQAPLEDIEFFCNKLDEQLHQGQFYTSPNMRPHVKKNLRVMFQRMQPSKQDIKTWHGIIKNLSQNK